MLLREALATTSCHTTMIAHVSDAPARHAETLSTAQLAARVHRLRRKKVKVGSLPYLPCPPQGPGPSVLLGSLPRMLGELGLPVSQGSQDCAYLVLPRGRGHA